MVAARRCQLILRPADSKRLVNGSWSAIEVDLEDNLRGCLSKGFPERRETAQLGWTSKTDAYLDRGNGGFALDQHHVVLRESLTTILVLRVRLEGSMQPPTPS